MALPNSQAMPRKFQVLDQLKLPSMIQKGFFSPQPWYLILYVTAHCNSKCKFCFYWEQIENADRSKELSLEEMEKLSRHLPALYQLTLTGGEPFMRPGLDKIISFFYKNSGVRRITLPSNGWFTEKMIFVLEQALSACPEASISINFSLDNLYEAHDQVRGLPGNFNRMLGTIKRLRELQSQYPNLFLGAATTASSFNIDDLIKIIDFVYDQELVDHYGIMLARGHVYEEGAKDFPLEKYWEALRYHTRRMNARSANRVLLQTLYETKKQTIEDKRMVDTCRAGEKLIVISERGMVYPCELLPPFVPAGGQNYDTSAGIEDFSFGNIRDADYNVPALLGTERAKKIQAFIRNRGCWCTFECSLINNLFFSPRAYAHMAQNTFFPGETARV